MVDPRNMVYSWATDEDDPTEPPRWGQIGKQRIPRLTRYGKSGRRLALYGGCGDPGAFER